MILGEHAYANPSKIVGTVSRKAENSQVEVAAPYSPGGKSRALNALYRGEYYETGPLARAMSMGYPLIKNIHRRFKDSVYSRVNARAYEIGHLLYRIKQSLRQIDVAEPSYIPPELPIRELSGEGVGVAEAPRGPLIHRLTLEAGIIRNYRMITPTQWNLASGPKEAPGVAQHAMIGSTNPQEAEFIFRSFDVCSVCTTH